MSKISLNVPGYNNVPTSPLQTGPGRGIEDPSLGGVISGFLGLVFYLALFLSFFWFVWGAYEYMVAQGNKEGLAAARNRIRWSIIGFAALILAFLVGNWSMNIFPFLRPFYSGEIPKIQDPTPGSMPTTPQFNLPPCEPGQPC